MNRKHLILTGPVAALVLCLPCTRSLAQTDMAAMAHHAAANQLGVMEYCRSRGDVGADAVDAQKAAIARLPASDVSTDADLATGKTGTLTAPNGQTMSLSDVAAKQGVSVSALCHKLGDGAIQSAKAGAGMTMPSMPSGMPAMPSGMPAMPSMPSMPSMPTGTTPH